MFLFLLFPDRLSDALALPAHPLVLTPSCVLSFLSRSSIWVIVESMGWGPWLSVGRVPCDFPLERTQTWDTGSSPFKASREESKCSNLNKSPRGQCNAFGFQLPGYLVPFSWAWSFLKIKCFLKKIVLKSNPNCFCFQRERHPKQPN